MTDEASNANLDTRGTEFGIDEGVTRRIRTQAQRFKKLLHRTVMEAWNLGRDLVKAKKDIRHGYWIPWVETQVGLEERTAQRLMAFYNRDPEKRHVTHFKSVAEALRALPPAAKLKSAPAGTDEASARKATGTKSRTVAKDLAMVVARLEPILQEMSASESRRREEDLQALVEVTILAATVVDKQLKLPAGDNGTAVELSDEAVEKLRDVLATVTRQHDA